MAEEIDADVVVEGSNFSDTKTYRPGKKALNELHIVSPLAMADMTKTQIREAALKLYKLEQAHKPSNSCYATRFPYNTKLTKENLKNVDVLEDFLYDQGYDNFRVRYDGNLIRLELPQDQIKDFMNRNNCSTEFLTLAKSLNIPFVTVDLEGFRSGCFDDNDKE